MKDIHDAYSYYHVNHLTVQAIPSLALAMETKRMDEQQRIETVSGAIRTVLEGLNYSLSDFDLADLNPAALLFAVKTGLVNDKVNLTFHSRFAKENKSDFPKQAESLAFCLNLEFANTDDSKQDSAQQVDWLRFFKCLAQDNEFDFKISKIDLDVNAINMIDVPKVAAIKRCYLEGDRVFTSAKTSHIVSRGCKRAGKVWSYTAIMLGDLQSQRCLTIVNELVYRQVYQQKVQADIHHWIRFNLTLGTKVAQVLVKAVIQTGSFALAIKQDLRKHYRFYSKVNATKVGQLINQHRAYRQVPMARWWQKVTNLN